MRVVDLLNALQRFPGNVEASISGDVTVGGVPIVVSGKMAYTPIKGTKGAGMGEAAAVPRAARAARRAPRPPQGA